MMAFRPSDGRVSLHKYFFAGLLVLFSYAFCVNAWVVDDAYISFRTVDNFVNGYGLRWNIAERVQTYTHPLWMFVVTPFYLITSEAFYTVIAVSYVLCIATIMIVAISLANRSKEYPWKPSLLILLLISSKAFIDYTSSGLENPLSYFLAAIFYVKFMFRSGRDEGFTRKDVFWLYFLASLAYTNRPDTILLYIPPLIYVTHQTIRKEAWGLVPLIVIATLPSALWVMFSLIYYGFPFPNTAYAKLLNTGIPFSWKVLRGLRYLANSMYWDAPSYIMALLAVMLSIAARSRRSLVLMCGVAIYVIYVITSGASATHLSGRFLALPLFVSFLILLNHVDDTKLAVGIAGGLIVFIVLSPISPIKMGTVLYRPGQQDRNCIDGNWFAHNEGAALINWVPGSKLPDHAWYYCGLVVRKRPQRIHIGGPLGEAPIGYFGFAAGPEKAHYRQAGSCRPSTGEITCLQTLGKGCMEIRSF